MNLENGRVKFMSGDDLKFTPRVFAQRYFYKLGEEVEFEEEISDIQVRTGKMIFKQGEDEEDLDEVESLNMERPIFPPQPPRPPQNNPTQLSRDIYNQLLILNELYRDLESYDTTFSDELREMISELNIVSFAMLRIYQTLSRNNRPPIQNQRKPRIRDFCSGVVATSNYLRGIMFDLRRLQRMIDNQNIETQLFIINFTLQAQQQQLMQMRQYCNEGVNL